MRTIPSFLGIVYYISQVFKLCYINRHQLHLKTPHAHHWHCHDH